MANKRYYWFKMKEDFFNSDGIRYLEDIKNGYTYIVFFQKLCLDSLNSDGKLIRQLKGKLIPHDEKSLRRIVNMDIDINEAMNALLEAGLIDILDDGTIYIIGLADMTGSETKWAEKKRLQRQKDKAGTMSLNCPTDIETEKEIDKDKEIEKELDINNTPSKVHYGNYANVLLSSEEYSELLSKHGKHKLELCIKLLDEKIENIGYKYNNHYVVINDWVIEEVNKRIREGKYPKEEVSQESFNDFLNLFTPQLEDYLDNPF